MIADVIPLKRNLHTPIGHVIRTGGMTHRRYGHTQAEGRLPAKDVIIDASKAQPLKEKVRYRAHQRIGERRLERPVAATKEWVDHVAGMHETMAEEAWHAILPLRRGNTSNTGSGRRVP